MSRSRPSLTAHSPSSPAPLFSFLTVLDQRQPPNPRGVVRSESFQLQTVCILFSLIAFFGKDRTIAWGFKCVLLDSSRGTSGGRANSAGTGRRDAAGGRQPPSPTAGALHPGHLGDYLPRASASGGASYSRPSACQRFALPFLLPSPVRAFHSAVRLSPPQVPKHRKLKI